MKFNFFVAPLLTTSVICLGSMAYAQDTSYVEEITITGGSSAAGRISGSAHFIGQEQLKLFEYTDIQRIAREVPGVSIQVEDGYGLRPNISIRGVTTERSSRITLLEDNVLIAPAPYSAPSAYYFPTAGRLEAIEVVKGPSAITQGPYTIGGALNMISTSIPSTSGGNLLLEGGQDSTYRVHANYGGYLDNGFGFLLEAHEWQSEGFQEIDRSNSDTGLDVSDYMLKLAYAPEQSRHSVELKLQLADQQSNQSYLGLTDDDFSASPYRRYGLSELDNIETDHDQVILRYKFAMTESMNFSATAYNNRHARNWFKTEGIDLDGSPDADSLSRTSWSTIINDINLGNSRDGFSAAELQAIMDGTLDTPAGSIDVRANNREYFSRGIQFALNWEGVTGNAGHSIEAGLRLHEDEEDRLQYDSSFQQLGGQLILNDVGELGAAGNRVQEAEALAFYVQDNIEWGNWSFTPGIRYEDIDQVRTDFSGGVDRVISGQRNNATQVWLPGLGISYQFSPELALITGVHKGFTAPTNSPGIDPEQALNYEAGFRYLGSSLNADVIAFYSDYENLLGVCTASSGTDCNIGDAFNGDAATIKGLEVLVSAELARLGQYAFPLSLTYTYTDGQFDTSIADTGFFGDVDAGDPIPYIPENQFRLSFSMNALDWNMNISANYIDSVCTRASCDIFEQTDDSLIVDFAAAYQLSDRINVFGRIENLTEEQNIMGRQPYGARPNKARTAALGLRVSF